MPNRTDIAERVRTTLSEHLGVGVEALTDSASLIEDLGADSLDRVEILFALDEGFRIEITDDEAEPVKTVGDVIALIERKVS